MNLKLNFNLDITDKSKWITITPNTLSKNLPFCLEEIGYFYAQKDYFTERKGKDNYLLIYTKSGKGILEFDNSVNNLIKGSIALIDCSKHHKYKAANDSWEFEWIHFSGLSSKYYYKLLFENGFSIISLDNTLEIDSIFDCLFEYSSVNTAYSNVLISKNITDLLSCLTAKYFISLNDIKFKKYQNEINNVINYIENNYFTNINISDLQSQIFLSKFYFIKLFKEYTGQTPYEYILNYRVTQAKKMLKCTNDTIQKIALQVGFNDESNFIRTFKRVTNKTPNEYRNSIGIK